MAEFRMRCRKCKSFNIDLEHDRSVGFGGYKGDVQIHCGTCGDVIFGEKACQEEANRQYAEWQESRARMKKLEAEMFAKAKAKADAERMRREQVRAEQEARRLEEERRRAAAKNSKPGIEGFEVLPNKRLRVYCATCETPMERTPSQVRACKSKEFSCSKPCRDAWFAKNIAKKASAARQAQMRAAKNSVAA